MNGDDRTVLRDRELIELLADEPELLAILDAYAVTQAEAWQSAAAPRRSRALSNRLLARRGPVVALGLALAIAVVALLPSRFGSDANIVERALAGVSTGPVLHAALEVPLSAITQSPSPASFTVVDPASGRERAASVTIELWYDANRKLLRVLQRNEGAVAWELLETPAGIQDSRGRQYPLTDPPTISAALAAFFKGYKQSLADGSATVAGIGVVDGRDVQWLRFPSSVGNRLAQEVAVDTKTYRPLFLRSVCSGCPTQPPVYRILALEGIGRGAANFSPPPTLAPDIVAAYGGEWQTTSIAEARSIWRDGALWAGSMIGDMQLRSVRVVRPSSHSGSPPTDANLIARGLGIQFTYATGRGDVGAESSNPGETLTVSESAEYEFVFSGFNFNNTGAGQPLTRYGGALPPEGEVALSSTQPGHWTAQLKRDGLYIEIDGPSRELLLDAVDALVPIQG